MERTIQVAGISDELLSQLDERASEIGIDRSSYIRILIERAVAPSNTASKLAEILGPVQDYTEAQGMSEEEIERFFHSQVKETRRERSTGDGGESHG